METYGWFKEEYEKAKDTFEFKLESLEIVLIEKIIERMDECNISRSELATRLNKSKAYISKIFNNGSNLTLKSILALAEAVECTISIDLIKKNTKYETESYFPYKNKEYLQASDDYVLNIEDDNNVTAYC